MLAGQSNMQGQGFPDPPQQPDSRILREGVIGAPWTIAQDPLNHLGVGPGMSFARELVRRHPAAQVVLVPCAVGGTAIDTWQPGMPNYNRCVTRTRDAVRRGGVLKGILFAQGESDGYTLFRAGQWAKRYQATIRGMRHSLSSVPVVHTVLAADAKPATFPGWNLVKAQQRRQLNRDDIAVETQDLPLADGLHFTVPAYHALGRRMAGAWTTLTLGASRAARADGRRHRP
jgi:hypothetical protein